MRISDWSSDVCSSDLRPALARAGIGDPGASPGMEICRMDMKGESRIEAPRDRVWTALNDPEVLKASIPGCEELERTDDEIGSAACRERVCKYGEISVVAVAIKKKKK